MILVFRAPFRLQPYFAPGLGSGSQSSKGRVWNGKLIFRPSDWPARTPLTRRATLIGPGGTPSARDYIVCRGGALWSSRST
ncbi:hypothetical protein P7K49_018207, partial [Saguinus oedipus]